MKSVTVNQWTRLPNMWLLVIFSILWMVDGGLTVWATNNGYIEAWNQWTRLISSSSLLFIFIKLITLGMVIWIVRWANRTFPYVVFIALVVFNIFIGTVTAANIITILGT